MMKKYLALLLAVLMVLSVFTACAPQDNADTKPTDTKPADTKPADTQPPETTEPEKDYSDVEFSIVWWGGDTRHQQTIEIIEEFEKLYPGLEVNVDYVGFGDYATKISTYAAGGDVPDVMQLTYLMVPDYAKNGVIAPLDDYIADGSIDLSKCDLSVNASCMYQDETYAVATGANAYCLLYDPAVLAEAGATLSMTPTLSEYVEACKTVYEKTGKKADPMFVRYIALSLNEDFYVEDSNEVAMSAETMAACLEVEMTGIEEGYFFAPSDPVTWDPAADFANGDMWANVQLTNLVQQIETDSGKDLALCQLPVADNATNPYPTYLQPTMAWGIGGDSENKELAAAFINFFVNNQVVYEIAGADRGIPISSDMKAFLAEGAGPSLVKVVDYLNWLGDGKTTPMNGYSHPKAADADAIFDTFREEVRYLQVPKDQLLERIQQVIDEMNAALKG